MKKIFSILILLIISQINELSQTTNLDNYVALGFEGSLPGPYESQPPMDTLAELNANLWQPWDVTQWEADYLDVLYSYGFKFSFFQAGWFQTRAWGQQTIYQAEETSSPGNNVEKYKYKSHWSRGEDIYDNSSYGNGVRVRHYIANPNNPQPGYVLTDADEFFEQTGSILSQTNIKYKYKRTESDSLNIWYIMPRMRIDSGFAVNNPQTPVVKVQVLSYNGDIVKEVIIKCENFRKSNFQYTNGIFRRIPASPKRSAPS